MLTDTVSSSLPNEKAEPKKPQSPGIPFSLLDLNGKTHALDRMDTKRVRAFVFVSTECPISNGYIQTLNDLHSRHKDKLDFYGVVAEPTVTRTQAARHFAEYKANFPTLFDASGLLASVLRPTHVPQAFLLDPDGKIVYSGAIDNAWLAIGRRRPMVE